LHCALQIFKNCFWYLSQSGVLLLLWFVDGGVGTSHMQTGIAVLAMENTIAILEGSW
jgi:hypothetical protein